MLQDLKFQQVRVNFHQFAKTVAVEKNITLPHCHRVYI